MRRKALKKRISDVFSRVFDTADGRTVLYWIANECGVFQSDPTRIRPELMAFWNRLMLTAGVTDPSKAGKLMERLMEVASLPGTDTRSDDDGLDV